MLQGYCMGKAMETFVGFVVNFRGLNEEMFYVCTACPIDFKIKQKTKQLFL